MGKLDDLVAEIVLLTSERDSARTAYINASEALDRAKTAYVRSLHDEERGMRESNHGPLCAALQDDTSDIFTLSIDPRWSCTLMRSGLRTVGAVARQSGNDILAIKYIGVVGLDEVKTALAIRAASQVVATVGR